MSLNPGSNIGSDAYKAANPDMPAWLGGGGRLDDKLPKLARGGIVNKDIIARIGEGNASEAVIPLSPQGLQPLAEALIQQMGSPSNNNNSAPIVYVHTMIADRQGLAELERKLHIVRMNEQRRRGE